MADLRWSKQARPPQASNLNINSMTLSIVDTCEMVSQSLSTLIDLTDI